MTTTQTTALKSDTDTLIENINVLHRELGTCDPDKAEKSCCLEHQYEMKHGIEGDMEELKVIYLGLRSGEIGHDEASSRFKTIDEKWTDIIRENQNCFDL